MEAIYLVLANLSRDGLHKGTCPTHKVYIHKRPWIRCTRKVILVFWRWMLERLRNTLVSSLDLISCLIHASIFQIFYSCWYLYICSYSHSRTVHDKSVNTEASLLTGFLISELYLGSGFYFQFRTYLLTEVLFSLLYHIHWIPTCRAVPSDLPLLDS